LIAIFALFFKEESAMSSTAAFIIAMLALAFIIVLFFIEAINGKNLNIQSKPVGDGQYGTARWATPKEINETYEIIPFEPEKWRTGNNLPDLNGATVLGYIARGKRRWARVILRTATH
jgi:type IV secretion system protein VirD4